MLEIIPEEAIEVNDNEIFEINELDETTNDDLHESSHMEADSDEDDPEMVECPLCSMMTHVSLGKCSNENCTHIFKFTTTGHMIDGFVCEEDEIEYEDEDEIYESEAEMDYGSESDSETENNDGNCWCNDDDSDWEP